MHSVAGATYDLFGYVKPSYGVSHNGIKFTTPTVDNDIFTGANCANYLGGGFWYTKCGVFGPTCNIPSWYSPPDEYWYSIKIARMMIKLQ